MDDTDCLSHDLTYFIPPDGSNQRHRIKTITIVTSSLIIAVFLIAVVWIMIYLLITKQQPLSPFPVTISKLMTPTTSPLIMTDTTASFVVSNKSTTSTSTNCSQTSWNPVGDVVANGGYYGSLAVDDDFNVYTQHERLALIQKWVPGTMEPVNVPSREPAYSCLFWHKSTGSLYFVSITEGNPKVYKLPLGQTTPVKVAFGNEAGSALNQMAVTCRGMYVNTAGDILVLDSDNQRVLKWPINAKSAILMAGGGGRGNGPTQLSGARGIFVDEENSAIYVADVNNNRIQKYINGSTRGVTILDAAIQATLNDAFTRLDYLQAVTVDRLGNILIGDSRRITKWRPGSTFVEVVAEGDQGSGDDVKPIDQISALIFDKHENLYAIDSGNNRVLKYNSTSTSCSTKNH